MSWTIIIISILLGIIKIVITCIPTNVAEWLVEKFSTHQKLDITNVTVMVDDRVLENQEKVDVIKDFNEATFIEKHYIHPGDEELFLDPKDNDHPLVIKTLKGEKEVHYYIYSYDDHVDVVKCFKNKVIAYRLRSKNLQKRATLEDNQVLVLET